MQKEVLMHAYNNIEKRIKKNAKEYKNQSRKKKRI